MTITVITEIVITVEVGANKKKAGCPTFLGKTQLPQARINKKYNSCIFTQLKQLHFEIEIGFIFKEHQIGKDTCIHLVNK